MTGGKAETHYWADNGQAAYQSRFIRYLRDRGLLATDGRRVWGIFGDGEMDEPESIAGLPGRAPETRRPDLRHPQPTTQGILRASDSAR